MILGQPFAECSLEYSSGIENPIFCPQICQNVPPMVRTMRRIELKRRKQPPPISKTLEFSKDK
jgi:hypothetical protein